MNNELMRRLFVLCDVPRWVIVPMSRPQSVAEHSFRVAVIGSRLVTELWRGQGSAHGLTEREMLHDVMMFGLIHDNEEAITGDIPSNVPKPLAPPHGCAEVALMAGVLTRAIVKMADLVEAIDYLRHARVTRHDIGDELIAKLDAHIDDCKEKWPNLPWLESMETLTKSMCEAQHFHQKMPDFGELIIHAFKGRKVKEDVKH